MDIDVAKVRLVFTADEVFALGQMARKYNIDPGNLIRIATQVILEAERRGVFKIGDPITSVGQLSKPELLV